MTTAARATIGPVRLHPTFKHAAARRWRWGPRAVARSELVVFVVALAARLSVILRHGGLNGLFGYDSGVYFAGSDALIHGRMPYRDYVQLHPPAITVALTPFALLTKVVSDSTAFTVTIVAFTALGAANAALVVRLGRRLGYRPGAALTAGLFAALWMGSINAEYLIKLETLGNTLLLTGLVLALRAERAGARTWRSAVAGIPLGWAVSDKIWWIVPAAAVVVWHATRVPSARRGLAMGAGAIAAAAVLDAPFFVAAPRQMWSMVVVDQLSRPRAASPSVRSRLADLSSVGLLPHLPSTWAHVLFALVAAAAGIAVVSAWQLRAARPVVGLAVVQLIVVLCAPSWFAPYCDYLTVACALTVGAAVAARPATRQRVAMVFAASVTPVVAVLSGFAIGSGAVAVSPFPAGTALAASVRHVSCVMSDAPAAQLRLDALSRGLASGCPNWIDVTGRTYGPDKAPGVPRGRNARWHRDLLRYLRHGQAIILVRTSATGENSTFYTQLTSQGPLAHAGGHTIWRRPPAQRPKPRRSDYSRH